MYDPARSRGYKDKIALFADACMHNEYKGKAIVPDGSGFKVRIIAEFTIPPSFSKKRKVAAMNGTIQPTKKPDCDNIIKGILDALNGIVWTDDRLVTSVALKKVYSNRDGVNISIFWKDE